MSKKLEAFYEMEIVANLSHKQAYPFDVGDYNYRKIIQYVRENPDCRLHLSCVFPESDKQRRFFEGSLIPLIAFYNGQDYHKSSVLKDIRNDVKMEFWSEMKPNLLTGKLEKKTKSTKGSKALNAITEKVSDFLVEQYGAPYEAMDVKEYKKWRDIELMNGAPDNFIDYLLEIGILRKN